jgi:Uma2 family endonuclease
VRQNRAASAGPYAGLLDWLVVVTVAILLDLPRRSLESAMAEAAEKRWTVEEFLDWNDGTDRRHELVDGRIVSMAPPSESHAAIVSNLTIQIGAQLRPPCRVLGEFGVRLEGRDDSFYQFDLAVTCAPAEATRRYVVDPVLIVEVLSPSTQLHDRGRKLDDYRQLPSVDEILLVASEQRHVQHWRRDGPRWIVEDLIGDADLRLAAIPGPIPLAALYEGSGV